MRSIGEVARLLNVHTQTLRNWERQGLIRPNRIGHVRVYSTFDMQRLKKIKEYSGRGIHIRGIKELLRLNGSEPAGKPENGGAA
jgi:MerR family transcriptional regulator/heat shock protein HspR